MPLLDEEELKRRAVFTPFKPTERPNIIGNKLIVDFLLSGTMKPLTFAKNNNMQMSEAEIKKAILLFGPAGTGKTEIAKLIAFDAGMTLIMVTSRELTSKWTGETQKLVSSLFEVAKAHQPCLIFLDEIDSIGRERQPDEGKADLALNQMLFDFGELRKQNHAICLFAATNLPNSLDAALLTRFQNKIHVALPTRAERIEILKCHLKGNHNITEDQFTKLAEYCGEVSGRDLLNVVQNAKNACYQKDRHNVDKTVTFKDLMVEMKCGIPVTSEAAIRRMEEMEAKFPVAFHNMQDCEMEDDYQECKGPCYYFCQVWSFFCWCR